MPNFSSGYQAHLQGVNRDDPEVILLEISHPDLATPIRVCSDVQDLTSNGQLFVAIPFNITLPDERDRQAPRVLLQIDNIGRELMGWLEQAQGGAGATMRVRQVRRSAPNNVELDFTVGLQTVMADMTTVQAELGYDHLLDRPAIGIRYDPVVAPGLF